MTYHIYSRREAMRIALGSAVGVSQSGWFSRLARAAIEARSAKSCILLWMPGAPSQFETLDPKPNHPNGGPTKAIATSVTGIQIAENLPKIANLMRDLSIVRSMHTGEGDHGRATQLMMTGYKPTGGSIAYPVIGSMVAQRLIQESSELPSFVSIAPFRSSGLGSGFLGPKYSPLLVSGSSNDPNTRANLTIENLSPIGGDLNKMRDRAKLLETLRMTTASSKSDSMANHAAVYDQALKMVDSQGGGAFRLDDEPEKLRDAYGRNRFGQGCLLARRLVERGVPFVEVSLSNLGNTGGTWDTHADNFRTVKSMCDVLDPAWSTLITDLKDRGMYESTLVIWMGEFGRTPKINTNNGRDHYPDGWSMAMGGAGIKTGQVIGDTGIDGTRVERPVTTPELHATIFKALDIDPSLSNQLGDRPIPLVDEHALPISELLS